MCYFFSRIRLYLILFSRSDHCRHWKGVMQELLAVSFQRDFDQFNKELMKKRKEKKKSPLRPSALTEIIQLMYNRSLWPSVMAELTEKFAYKQTECAQKMMEQENWMTDDASPPAPARRSTKLPLQARRRRRGKPLRVRFAPY